MVILLNSLAVSAETKHGTCAKQTAEDRCLRVVFQRFIPRGWNSKAGHSDHVLTEPNARQSTNADQEADTYQSCLPTCMIALNCPPTGTI